jgi:hypothetical protein
MLDDKLIKRFYSKLQIKGPNECWEFKGANRYGYGQLKLSNSRKIIQATHVSYLISNKLDSIPKGLHVCHRCDNPPCCNPQHLFLGTAKDNSDDKINKGRNKCGPQEGQKNGNSSLTEKQVKVIIKEIKLGKTNVSIAKEFSVTHSLISAIRLGKAWVNLTKGPLTSKYSSTIRSKLK